VDKLKNGIIIGIPNGYVEGGLCMMAPIKNGKNKFEKSFNNWMNPHYGSNRDNWTFEFKEDVYDGSCFSFGEVSTRYTTSKDWLNINFKNPIYGFSVVFQISMQNISELLTNVDIIDGKLVGPIKIDFNKGKVRLKKFQEKED